MPNSPCVRLEAAVEPGDDATHHLRRARDLPGPGLAGRAHRLDGAGLHVQRDQPRVPERHVHARLRRRGSPRTNVVTNGAGTPGMGVMKGSFSRGIHWPSPVSGGLMSGSSGFGGQPISGSLKLAGGDALLPWFSARISSCASFSPVSPVIFVLRALEPLERGEGDDLDHLVLLVAEPGDGAQAIAHPGPERRRLRDHLRRDAHVGGAVDDGVTRGIDDERA